MVQKLEKVNPGELITADFINDMIANIADLQTRVAKIETDTAPIGTPQITSPKSGEVHRIGEELRVVGVNFGRPSEAAVYIDSTVMVKTPDFKGGSSDRLLIFDIPFVQNITDAGREVTLAVKNNAGEIGSTSFWLSQPKTLPSGTLTVTYTGAPSAQKLEAGKKYTFIYTIRAGTTDTETYDLEPSVSSGWLVRIVDEHDVEIKPEITISKPAAPTLPTKATVRVQVEIPQNPGNNTTMGKLKLKVTSQQNPSNLFRESDEETLTINQKPPEPNAIGVSLVSVSAPGSEQNGVIVVPKPAGGTDETTVYATFKAEVPIKGNYSIQNPAFPNDTSGKWAASIVPPSSGIDMTPPETTFYVSITAKADAPTTTMILKVVSDTNSKVNGDIYQNVRSG